MAVLAPPSSPPLPSLPSPSSTSTLSPSLLTRTDIQKHLDTLTIKESSLDSRLNKLITNTQRLTTQLKTLDDLREVVGTIQGEAEHTAREIGAVAQTAERVGAKVRGLDEEQVRFLPSFEAEVGGICGR